MTYTPLFSLWMGQPTWMERLCVASLQRVGHDITVFTYAHCKDLSQALGCRVLDARSVMAEDQDLSRSSAAAFSDHFRLEGIAKGLGVWTDLDVVFLKPLPPNPYIFGWQNDSRIGNSVLGLPQTDLLLQDYLTFCRRRPLIRYAYPWMPWTRRVTRTMKGALAPFYGEHRPAPKYGPDALTHFVHKHGIESLTYPRAAFYPLEGCVADVCRIHDEDFVHSRITSATIGVHLWRSTYIGCHTLAPPTSGWLEDVAKSLIGVPSG